MEKQTLPAYQNIRLPLLAEKNVHLQIKRLDVLHPEIQGNKYYKLLYNIRAAKEKGCTGILTFGGAFSNHVHATAISAAQNELAAIAMIRGEIPQPLNPTLADAAGHGMQLYPMSRAAYREKEDPKVLEQLQNRFGNVYVIPEGGTNALAIKGTSQILNTLDTEKDILALPVGTGGTFAGLLASAHSRQLLLGFSVLKGEFIHAEINRLLETNQIRPRCSWQIQTSYHFGGYAKFTPELIAFIKEMKNDYALPLDPVYTGKMLFGLLDMVSRDRFKRGTRILAIHTGGLQGIRGFNQRFGTGI
ncbi:1-aminocyclopropane-1-carboxylate deaminase/D-cysteine desulfhydrase, PLP-dependent ACC family [Cyclobacterium lianum]|uniref:1-aminocyclopropane-1-carboxylate deaminase/D-cysteine desulfhydrase, PLP-dependent ACC family n=1 Tax=Cyclobacterium lianum TaxID=388280 RepID=A0A1M7IAV0_9BACT|nr:pyridoxal-phosphate dependent enzyme [Cyclobacterium lianum]SHM37805.1 1-aminocyclopropane-1-carboxylate deaminase/D-cysteine desulfhydrase, PLP-dependent ACC family [Cyclobacterium lianum]